VTTLAEDIMTDNFKRCCSNQFFVPALLLGALLGSTSASAAPADSVYINANIHTIDQYDSVHEALGVSGGRITYIGTNAGAKVLIGPSTRVIDVGGRMVMPGLVDGHMHPLQGGTVLLKCNLNYERLTVAQMLSRIQGCLDDSRSTEPDKWLEVSNWFREAMVPNGVTITRETLDSLKTRRPIFVMSSFGHTALVNTRALRLAQITANAPDPPGGRIDREPSGEPSGILEDSASEKVTAVIPKPTTAEQVRAAEAALDAMRQQGITTFLDAMATPETLAAFAGAQQHGKLTARGHFAVLITPEQGRDPKSAVATAKKLAVEYDQGELKAQPGITVRNIKLFMDGVITAPACTGALLEPYFINTGTPDKPQWVPGKKRGPDVYFAAALLHPILIEAARVGLEPHMHADGDRAVREALDGIEALRRQFPGSAIRAAIAHDEIVNPADFARYKQLDAIPVLSFQWEKRAPDTIDGAQDYLGPERFKYIEPAGYLVAAGARIAYGSDWPVDPLNEWFALKVGVTRTNDPSAGEKYAGRLSTDPGLPLSTVMRAITMNSAYELHSEREVGSLEVGKLADLIVLDRNLFKIPPEQLADVKVLLTVVGGKPVYETEALAAAH
jgi:predicted amidohydrolase YtcJ